eukprot:CAMPEP_0170493454 /NCGR_PEP_ID=MMETSP0208-20121228/13923_1 /TAXON_ID=197538 /ORGANISM="Strombidium inclinatum, Strain S3" /LENGTH=76 /DNA_ID=CAMNT_0010769381 /DNA_START=6 /DNA_END=236 /DNA_ORIENTATION=+
MNHPPQDQMEYMQNKMMMDMVTQVQINCFTDCVSSYKGGDLDSSETNCIKNCAARQFGLSQAFGELSEKMGQRGGF